MRSGTRVSGRRKIADPQSKSMTETVRDHDTLTDAEIDSQELLLPAVANGDMAAVAKCIDRYGNLVWSLARRQFSSRELAEDAVQDIFIHLWEVADRFDPALGTETTFVSMIARRRSIDLRRKHLRRSASTQSMADASDGLESLPNGDQDVAETLALRDEAEQAESLLAQLPDIQQQVIRLSVYQGLSHARIADTTGLPAGTVKTYIRRGLSQLRDRLFQKSNTTSVKAKNRRTAGGHS